MEIPIIVVNGSQEGPTLWLTSTLHGTETTGIFAIVDTIARLNPSRLCGAIVAAPIVNVVAAQARQRFSPIDFDPTSMNRAFPGDPHGSFTHRVSSILWKQIDGHANYLIDFHSFGDLGISEDYTIVVKDGDARGLAQAFGFKYICETTDEIFINSSLSSVATRAGIPSILVESGGIAEKERVEECQLGISNVLKYLGMIEGKPEVLKKYVFLSGWQNICAGHGGLYRAIAKPGLMVSKGDPLCAVTNAYGAEVEVVCSPREAVVLAMRTYPLISSGELVGEIGLFG